MVEAVDEILGADTVQEPMDLLQISINEKVLVKLRHGRELSGKLVVSPIQAELTRYFRRMTTI